MNLAKCRKIAAFSLLFLSQFSYAQGETTGSNYLMTTLIVTGLLLLVFAVMALADNLLQIEAQKSGIDTKKHNLGLFPSISGMFKKKAPSYIGKDAGYIALDKGFDLQLAGSPSSDIVTEERTSRYAIRPTDFIGMSPIPKVIVAVGDEVQAGQPIFFDKKRPEIMYAAPVSGEVVDIVRGAKRAITEVVILADKETKYADLNAPNAATATREEIKSFMIQNGLWSFLNQRPFDIVPSQTIVPANIFISTFSTAPLAPNMDAAVLGNEKSFQAGLDVLGKLTDGSVYLGLDGNAAAPSPAFANATGVVKNYFSGKHPAGNVGVQIHHTAPISGNEKVWTLDVQDVITIGKAFAENKFDASRIVSIGGSQVTNPRIVRVNQGANVGDLIGNSASLENARIIAGDVFTGRETSTDSFLGFNDDQISIIKEGNEHELFGWLLPIKPRPSISGTFPNFLFPDHKFEGETNTHGEKRAFVVTGQYESVLPMDIYPQHLMKAIMAGDFEKMEGLGINELSEEDLAVCEFVCTSKMPLQNILREGLNMMREQE